MATVIGRRSNSSLLDELPEQFRSSDPLVMHSVQHLLALHDPKEMSHNI